MDVNCNNLFGFMRFKLMLMYWRSPFFNKSQWSVPVKRSWDRGGGEKQNKNVTRSNKQLVLANVCCSRGKRNRGQELSPRDSRRWSPDLSLLSLPAMGTVFRAAKEDGCNGGRCSGVQKQRRAGVIWAMRRGIWSRNTMPEFVLWAGEHLPNGSLHRDLIQRRTVS